MTRQPSIRVSLPQSVIDWLKSLDVAAKGLEKPAPAAARMLLLEVMRDTLESEQSP